MKALLALYNWYAFTLARLRARFWRIFLGACGTNVRFMSHVSLTSPQYIRLGNNVLIGNYVSLCGQGGLTIGNHVMIGAFSQIMSVTHEYTGRTPIDTQPMRRAQVTIGDDVWIGTHVTVLPGLIIGNGAVVGANSVVTHDVLPYTVVGGVPARKITSRFHRRKK